ncbi:MAG: hypothetical protein QOJ87_1658 [Verrucomicrobiota bacterium]|jgi:hypothetical protein
MAMTFQSRLDAEVDERLAPIVENYNNGKNVEVDDIFSKDKKRRRVAKK